MYTIYLNHGVMNSSVMHEQQQTTNLCDWFSNYQPQVVDDNFLTTHDNSTQWKKSNLNVAIIGELTDGKRNKASVVNRSAVILDFDDVTDAVSDLDTFKQRLSAFAKDFTVICYPSQSSWRNYVDNKPRYHVVVPLTQPLVPADYQLMVAVLLNKAEKAGILANVDNSNKTLTQAFGLPVTSPLLNSKTNNQPLMIINRNHVMTAELQQQLINDGKTDETVQLLLGHKPKKAPAKQHTVSNAPKIASDAANCQGDDFIATFTKWAEKQQDKLADYNFWLNCSMRLAKLELLGGISHDDALKCQQIMAGDNEEYQQHNADNYQNILDTKSPDEIQSSDSDDSIAAQKRYFGCKPAWLSYSKGKPVILHALLAQSLIDEYHILNDGSLALYDNNGWHFTTEASRMLDTIIMHKLVDVAHKQARLRNDFIETKQAVIHLVNNSNNTITTLFERDESKLNLVSFNNITLDVTNWTVHPNRYADYIPCRIPYDLPLTDDNQLPDCETVKQQCELAISWVRKLTSDDTQFIFAWLGSLFTRQLDITRFDTRDDYITMFYGRKGNNGKSTLTSYITDYLVGSDNVYHTKLTYLSDNAFDRANTRFKLLIVADDMDGATIQKTDALKQLSGGDFIDSERKGVQNRDRFRPSANLLAVGNELPEISDSTDAMQQRLIAVPFNAEITSSYLKKYDLPTLRKQASYMALYCLYQWHLFLSDKQNTLQRTGAIAATTSQWQLKANPVRAFIDRYVELRSSAFEFGKYADDNKKLSLGDLATSLAKPDDIKHIVDIDHVKAVVAKLRDMYQNNTYAQTFLNHLADKIIIPTHAVHRGGANLQVLYAAYQALLASELTDSKTVSYVNFRQQLCDFAKSDTIRIHRAGRLIRIIPGVYLNPAAADIQGFLDDKTQAPIKVTYCSRPAYELDLCDPQLASFNRDGVTDSDHPHTLADWQIIKQKNGVMLAIAPADLLVGNNADDHIAQQLQNYLHSVQPEKTIFAPQGSGKNVLDPTANISDDDLPF